MMEPRFLRHVTVEGERWDQLSWRYYGDPYLYERIISANPEVPIIPVLDGGLELSIPILDDPAPRYPADLLPPWKRNLEGA